MDIYKLKTLSPEDRLMVLNEAVAVEENRYVKPLSNDEMTIMKDEFTQTAIQKAMIDDEFAQVKSDFKARIEPLNTKISECLYALKHKAVEIKGKVYMLADYDNKMMHTVDAEGNVINSRLMKPEERQHRLELTPTTLNVNYNESRSQSI
jgi:hypothetical protein